MPQISGDKRNVVLALLSLQDEARDEDEEETERGGWVGGGGRDFPVAERQIPLS